MAHSPVPWSATRPTRDTQFGAPALIANTNDVTQNLKPAVSADGLNIYWFGTGSQVLDVNTPIGEEPTWIYAAGTTLHLAVARHASALIEHARARWPARA